MFTLKTPYLNIFRHHVTLRFNKTLNKFHQLNKIISPHMNTEIMYIYFNQQVFKELQLLKIYAEIEFISLKILILVFSYYVYSLQRFRIIFTLLLNIENDTDMNMDLYHNLFRQVQQSCFQQWGIFEDHLLWELQTRTIRYSMLPCFMLLIQAQLKGEYLNNAGQGPRINALSYFNKLFLSIVKYIIADQDMNRYPMAFDDDFTKQSDKDSKFKSNVSLPKLSKSLSSHIPEQIKLPIVSLKKILGKIGAVSKKQPGFIPSQEQRRKFRALKTKQLKQSYPYNCKKRSGDPFKFEFDQIVLDCYQHGQMHGKKTVWRKYRQNIDSLSFDTMKILTKR